MLNNGQFLISPFTKTQGKRERTAYLTIIFFLCTRVHLDEIYRQIHLKKVVPMLVHPISMPI